MYWIKENIAVLESGYFFDYLCHLNGFLLSLGNFNLLLYFLNVRGRVPLAGSSLRAEKSYWQVQRVTLAGPKSHTRAKMSHWSVIILHYNMTVWNLARNDINFTIAAGLIRLHMPGVK